MDFFYQFLNEVLNVENAIIIIIHKNNPKRSVFQTLFPLPNFLTPKANYRQKTFTIKIVDPQVLWPNTC